MIKTVAIILLAGDSTRFKSNTPKQLYKINGKSLFSYCVENFINSSLIDEIVLVTNKKLLPLIENEINKKPNKKISQIIIGGKTRQESVSNALFSLKINDNDNVLIHDCARPLVSNDFIKKMIETLETNVACTAAIKSEDTVAKINKENYVDSFLNREEIYRIQTPQGFKYKTILDAHKKANNFLASDDAQLVKNLGIDVKIVLGDKKMNKITTIEDALYLEAVISNERI